MTKNEIEKRLKEANRIAIYGAGVVAQNAYLLATTLLNKEFCGFWVSEYNENDAKLRMTSQMYQQPIYDITKKKIDQDILVIIAVSEKYRPEIESILKIQDRNVNYLFLSVEVRNYMFESFYKNYFQKNEIDLHAKWLTLGDNGSRRVKIKNPFLEEARNQNSCFSELGTIILPGCMNDIRLASETPYELGHVTLDSFHKGVVFDLGANQGYFSVLAASLGHTVYAFEPSEKLISNLTDYSVEYEGRIHVEAAAVSDYDGVGNLFIDDFSDDANSLVLKTNARKEEQIKVVTLDEYVKNHKIKKINFIKADIEGAERNMLWGAKEVLREHAPLLSICTYHLPDDPAIITSAILEANPNYKIIQKEKKLYAYI